MGCLTYQGETLVQLSFDIATVLVKLLGVLESLLLLFGVCNLKSAQALRSIQGSSLLTREVDTTRRGVFGTKACGDPNRRSKIRNKLSNLRLNGRDDLNSR